MEKTNSPVPVFVTAGTIIHGRGIGKLICNDFCQEVNLKKSPQIY